MQTKLFRDIPEIHYNYGWLDTYYTFSFSGYYNSQRMGFAKLRVLNNDIIQAGQGFGTHPHQNMEIITIPLSGALEHNDSMGNHGLIHKNEVQLMSAGKGITHSEFNASSDDVVHLLQIWIQPNIIGVEPRYAQKYFEFSKTEGWQWILHPYNKDSDFYVNQKIIMGRIKMNNNDLVQYSPQLENSGVFIYMIDGETKILNHIMKQREGIGISATETIEILGIENSDILLIESPLE